ncbi:phosphoribosylaminoimidazolesuccinocarboxamide synthase [Candidatus Woesearchaeota archaeon]|nr:phosphoribosylaminoimidazolesuccinocarboxamide synthase [Candidatus Woesearchaeota archaeon]
MISKEDIQKQIRFALEKTDLPLGERYQGKVRDVYRQQERMIIITTDRISAFDHVLGTIPFKGQVLNQMAAFWFDKTKHIVRNHVLDNPDPNVMVVEECKAIPIEMVVRGYITGSLWREYAAGKRQLYGITFKEGLKKDQKFKQSILTPTTKEQYGKHDKPVSREEILREKIVEKHLYEDMEDAALHLFEKGTEIAAKHGLILVDTKYEFGLLDGELVLIDEIHTPDSSRFWHAKSYEQLFNVSMDQQMLDKEFVRQWLIERGFMGEGKPPALTDDLKVAAAQRYIENFELITGQEFEGMVGDVQQRIAENLRAYF